MSKFSRPLGAFALSVFGCLAMATLASAQSVSMLGNQPMAGQCYSFAKMEKTSSGAIKTCTKSLGQENLTRRDRAAVLVNRGILHRLRWDVQEAFDDYQAALEIIPDLAEAIANRGNIFYLGEAFDLAMADYDKALSLGIRQDQAVRLNRALLFAEMKHNDEARRSFEELLRDYPDYEMAKIRYERFKARMMSAS